VRRKRTAVSEQLTMYTTQWCAFCRRLKMQLARDGIDVM
jgi:mycoredoxin